MIHSISLFSLPTPTVFTHIIFSEYFIIRKRNVFLNACSSSSCGNRLLLTLGNYITRWNEGRVVSTILICVVTIQGLTGSWYLGRWKNIHGAVGMLGMHLFMGGQSMHAESCVPPCCLCMAHCMSPVPLHGTCHGTQKEVPRPLNTRTQTKLAACQQILCNRASYYTGKPIQGYGNSLLDPVSRL